MSTKKINQLEDYLKYLIREELKKQAFELRESDAKQIVLQIIPELDKLVSDRIKQHFIEIVEFIKNSSKKT